MSTVMSFVYVALGSMLGGVCRYALTLVSRNMVALSFPYGTLVSNLAGCLLMGIFAGAGIRYGTASVEMRLLLATGFCGGFTTMSSFVFEMGQFVQDKEYFYASGYFALTLAGAGLAFFGGLLFSQLLMK